MASEPESVDMYLLTVGRGASSYAIYGHTILRIVDRQRRIDMSLNWGTFDFRDPAFAWNFYLGDLRYKLGVSGTSATLAHYRDFEQRSVVQDRINLSTRQKQKLLQRIAWNLEPENLHYQYSHFYNNCSTRPRDYLDEVLFGKIKARYGKDVSHVPLRYHVRLGARALWWAYLGTDHIGNSLWDAPLTKWNEMFRPELLRRYLQDMPSYDDDGRAIPERPLLTETQILVDLPEPPNAPDPYAAMALAFVTPMLLAAGVAAFKGGKAARRALGFMSVGFGLWSGVLGVLLLANWLVSNYPELKHNAALWLFWPTDGVLLIFGVRLLGRASMEALARWVRLMRYYAMAHLVGLGILFLGYSFGLIEQNVLGILATSGLAALVYYGYVAYSSFRESGRESA